MKVELLGGFGEKGRTSLAVNGGGRRLLLDAGIKVGARGDEYYPALNGNTEGIDALLISHAHEDHIGALCWLLARGYRGPIFMTAETRDEAPATLAGYADQSDFERHPLPEERIEVFEPGDLLDFGGLKIRTGCSGHVVGGVWFAVIEHSRSIVYSADIVPDSRVFRMDPIPECDLLVLDASYGADPVSGSERGEAIAEWVAAHRLGCLLPTPLSGRSLELIAVLPRPFAIHAGMRDALESQIDAQGVLVPGVADLLRQRLREAADWREAEPLPSCPLLADDGMGSAGPSSWLIPRAREANYPILLTGHLPSGSPGEASFRDGGAEWIRMPTHPTLAGNVGVWEKAGRPVALGHSCSAADLEALQIHIPSLRVDCRTGQSLELDEVI